MNFYPYFLELCSRDGMAPSAAGENCGVSRTAVNGWSKGRIPTDKTFHKLSELFRVDISNFWNCDDVRAKRKKTANQKQETAVDSLQLRQELLDRPEIKILFDAAEDAPASAIYEAIAIIMKAKEGNGN